MFTSLICKSLTEFTFELNFQEQTLLFGSEEKPEVEETTLLRIPTTWDVTQSW